LPKAAKVISGSRSSIDRIGWVFLATSILFATAANKYPFEIDCRHFVEGALQPVSRDGSNENMMG
jgi:hypothetical protein